MVQVELVGRFRTHKEDSIPSINTFNLANLRDIYNLGHEKKQLLFGNQILNCIIITVNILH